MNRYFLLLSFCFAFNSVAMEHSAKKQKLEQENYSDTMPVELLQLILQDVGNQKNIDTKFENLKQLMRCRRVCKKWKEIADKTYNMLLKHEQQILDKEIEAYTKIDDEQ